MQTERERKRGSAGGRGREGERERESARAHRERERETKVGGRGGQGGAGGGRDPDLIVEGRVTGVGGDRGFREQERQTFETWFQLALDCLAVQELSCRF